MSGQRLEQGLVSEHGAGSAPALEVRGLSVDVRANDGTRTMVLDDVSFTVPRGGAVGLVGESGSGKSLTSLAIMGLLPANASLRGGDILLEGESLVRKSANAMRQIRGSRISMVLQDPMSSLDPSFTIGNQLMEALKLRKDLRKDEMEKVAAGMLARVRIPSPRERLAQYPHQLSGGMRQRVCSAIALAREPDVLIADEPTTALDVTTQAQYLTLLKELQESRGFALVLISHDLAIIRDTCEELVVMYAGQVVEKGPMDDVWDAPQHPYSEALFASIPSMDYRARLKAIRGQIPDPRAYPEGCRFSPRCEFARDLCVQGSPILLPRRSNGQHARCFGTEQHGWVPR